MLFTGGNDATLREKCPNTEFISVRIFLYSVRIQVNTGQKKVHIWTFFVQRHLSRIQNFVKNH